MNFQFFYRGDKYCTPTQCRLFREGLLLQEKQLFAEWQRDCDAKREGKCTGEHCGTLKCLALMQHYKANTRLLDFTEDPLVALRFACGEQGENCRKKVTIYCTEQIDLTQDRAKFDEMESVLIKLVTSNVADAQAQVRLQYQSGGDTRIGAAAAKALLHCLNDFFILLLG